MEGRRGEAIARPFGLRLTFHKSVMVESTPPVIVKNANKIDAVLNADAGIGHYKKIQCAT